MLLIWNLGNFGRGVHSLQNCKAICVNDVSGYAICSCLKLLRGPFILYKFFNITQTNGKNVSKRVQQADQRICPPPEKQWEKKIKQKTINQTL